MPKVVTSKESRGKSKLGAEKPSAYQLQLAALQRELRLVQKRTALLAGSRLGVMLRLRHRARRVELLRQIKQLRQMAVSEAKAQPRNSTLSGLARLKGLSLTSQSPSLAAPVEQRKARVYRKRGLSVKRDRWSALNDQRIALILREEKGSLTPKEADELQRLQALADARATEADQRTIQATDRAHQEAARLLGTRRRN